MNSTPLLKHFSLKLAQAEISGNVSAQVERIDTCPQNKDEFAVFSSQGPGKPVVFPATWCPNWSQILKSPSPLKGLATLLGNEVEVDVFTLQYGTQLTNQASAGMSEHPACDKIVQSRCTKRRKLDVHQTAQSFQKPSSTQDLPQPSTMTDDSSISRQHASLPLPSLWPIPRSNERRYLLGDFLKEAEAMSKVSKHSLLYLTWRGLPSPTCLDDDAVLTKSQEFKLFMKSCVHPATCPPFLDPRHVRQRNVWIGNSVTSQIHFDGLDNLHVCIQGTKTFHLYSPWDTPNLYPNPWKEGELNNESTLPSILCADAHHHQKFFKEVHGVKAVVSAGQAIYIPAGWWHEVFTLEEMTCSVNAWFEPPPRAHFRPTLMMIHSEEYYKKVMGIEEGDEDGSEGSRKEENEVVEL